MGNITYHRDPHKKDFPCLSNDVLKDKNISFTDVEIFFNTTNRFNFKKSIFQLLDLMPSTLGKSINLWVDEFILNYVEGDENKVYKGKSLLFYSYDFSLKIKTP